MTVLPPIVRHFDVVPGSLVCDVMLRTVPKVRQMTSSNNGQDDVVDVRNSGMDR
jgi:hypothetical protein